MSNKTKVIFNGKEVSATVIEVNQESSYWNNYLLDDQSVLKLKVILTKVARVDGAYDQEGNPVYVIQATNIVRVDCPDSLKKK